MRPAIRRTCHTEPGGLRLAFRGLDHVLVRCGDSSGPSLVIRSCRRTFDQGLMSVSCHYGVLVVLDPATCISRSGAGASPTFRASAVGSTGCSAARPASAAKGSTLQLGARRPTISSPRTPTCPPARNTRRSSRSPCALRVLSRRVRRMTPKRRKRRGESVPSPGQDKGEVVRAVLTRREIGVVTSAAAETARDHRHATLLLWPGGRNPTATLLLGRWIPMWYPPMATSSSARDPVMRFSAVRT